MADPRPTVPDSGLPPIGPADIRTFYEAVRLKEIADKPRPLSTSENDISQAYILPLGAVFEPSSPSRAFSAISLSPNMSSPRRHLSSFMATITAPFGATSPRTLIRNLPTSLATVGYKRGNPAALTLAEFLAEERKLKPETDEYVDAISIEGIDGGPVSRTTYLDTVRIKYAFAEKHIPRDSLDNPLISNRGNVLASVSGREWAFTLAIFADLEDKLDSHDSTADVSHEQKLKAQHLAYTAMSQAFACEYRPLLEAGLGMGVHCFPYDSAIEGDSTARFDSEIGVRTFIHDGWLIVESKRVYRLGEGKDFQDTRGYIGVTVQTAIHVETSTVNDQQLEWRVVA